MAEEKWPKLSDRVVRKGCDLFVVEEVEKFVFTNNKIIDNFFEKSIEFFTKSLIDGATKFIQFGIHATLKLLIIF